MDNTEHRTPATAHVPDAGEPTTLGADGATSAVLTARPADRPRSRFALYRSRSDVMLGGVCGGLAEELDVDPALIRIATIALTLVTGGGLALVYLAAWILAPREGLAVGSAV